MKKMLIALIIFTAFMGCKDVLDLHPIDTFSEEQVFGDANLTNNFVSSTYNYIRCPWSVAGSMIMDGYTDNSWDKWDNGTSGFTQGILNPDNVEWVLNGLWSQSYTGIRYTNYFFRNIEKSPVEARKKEQLIAEMKFIRAYIYSELNWIYNGVPIIEEVMDNKSDFSQVTRKSYDEVLDYIIKNLDEAAAILPLKQDGNNRGRPTKGAAMALKAKNLLYAASKLSNPMNDKTKWETAAKAYEDFFALNTASSLYSLNPDYEKLFLTLSDEAVFWREYTIKNPHYTDRNSNPNSYGGRGTNNPLKSLVDEYQMGNGKYITDPTSNYNPQNPFNGREYRFYISINYNNAQWRGTAIEIWDKGKDSPTAPELAMNATTTGYYMRKFLDKDNKNFSGEFGPFSTSPYLFLRLGTLYLDYAETQIALGKEQVARTYIDYIRVRAKLPRLAVTVTGDDLVKAYRHERRIETAFEGDRFYDIRRWMIAEEVLPKAEGVSIVKNTNGTFTYTTKVVSDRRTFDSKFYWFPIPRTEVVRTNGGIQQNPEWQ